MGRETQAKRKTESIVVKMRVGTLSVDFGDTGGIHRAPKKLG